MSINKKRAHAQDVRKKETLLIRKTDLERGNLASIAKSNLNETLHSSGSIFDVQPAESGEIEWVFDERNTILILNTLEFFNVPKMDMFGRADSDPLCVITSSAHTAFKYQSPYRSDDSDPKWVLRVPLLVRHDVNDKISIDLRDKDVISSQEIGALVLWTHDLIRRMGSATQLELVGNLPGNDSCTFRASFERQEWDDVYPVMGDAKADAKEEKQLDAFAKLLLTVSNLSAKSAKPIPIATLGGPSAPKGPQKLVSLLDGAAVILENDPDTPVSAGEVAFLKCLNILPMNDHGLSFQSRSHAESYMQKIMDGSFVHVHSEGPWGNVTSDESFTRYFFQNNGTVAMHKKAEGGFIAKMSHFQEFEVRPGYIRYGCDVHFRADGSPDRIEHAGKVIKPRDSEWDVAKMFARTTVFPMTSAVHLMEAHYIWANYPNIAMLSHLSCDHPVRVLLHVHYFRSANTISKAVTTLLPNKGLVHRSTAFEHAALVSIFKGTLSEWTYQSFPEWIEERGMKSEKSLFPLAWDGIDLHSTVCRYVDNYLDIYYADDEAVDNDNDLVAFYSMLADHLPGLPTLSLQNLKSVLGEFIFRVSGFHEHVGNVNVSGLSPAMVAPHIRDETLLNDVSSAVILGVITALTTGMITDVDMREYPCLADDWSEIMLDEKAKAVCQNFHAELNALSADIDVRNKNRPVFNDFNPVWVQTSVSG